MKGHWRVRIVTALHASSPSWSGPSRALSFPSTACLSPRTYTVHAGMADAPGWAVYARVPPGTGQGVLPGAVQDAGPGSRSHCDGGGTSRCRCGDHLCGYFADPRTNGHAVRV